jgi:NADH:ubiquinone oxidoreductase subunit H
VAGWKTEYSGKRLALLRLADDLDLVLFGGLLVTLFLGGANPIWLVPPAASFLLKLILCICFLALLRASSARFEVGRMVRDLWVYLTPLALAQAALAAMWR